MAVIKNLVNFAAKFFEMGKDKKKAKAKPVAKGKSKPVVKKASKPAAKKAAKPVAKKVSKPVKKKAAPRPKAKAVKPVKKAQPAAAKAKPVAKKAAKPAPKKAVKPAIKAKPPVAAKPAIKNNSVKAKLNSGNEVKPVKPEVKPEIKKAPVPAAKFVAPKPFQKNEVKNMNENNDPQLRYSDEELKEFKDLIDKKLVSAREELKNLKEALDNHTESQAGNKAWNMEEGTDTSEMEYLMNQISRQHQYIRNLELAMMRIENKTYGICRVTGKLIPKERLRVVPHATLSLEAKVSRKTEDVSPGASASGPPTDFSEGFED